MRGWVGGFFFWRKSVTGVCHGGIASKRTIFGSVVGFGDAPVARRRSFYGRDRGLGRRAIGGLGLRGLLFLFAAAEEAAEASFDLG